MGFVDVALDAAGEPVGDPAVYYYLCDAVGSVVRIVDAAGVVVNQYAYDAFGVSGKPVPWGRGEFQRP